MQEKAPINLGNRIHLIDGYDLGFPERTGTYVILEEELTLVETGPSMSIPHVLKGLQALELDPKNVKYIIVTHIHLDHSGGAGLLVKDCPNAKVVVHPRGARHLIKPDRLIEGAKAVYGDDFDRLFNPILPIPEERVIVKQDGETLQIGSNCTLTFYDTPGHANHHFSIHDPVSNGMFTGDTIGVRYEQLAPEGIELVLPSTSPSQFDPEAMLDSLNKIQGANVDTIFFGHFSASNRVDEVYAQITKWLPIFVETAQKHEHHQDTANELISLVKQELQQKGIQDDHPVYELIRLDLTVGAMGLHHYLKTKKK